MSPKHFLDGKLSSLGLCLMLSLAIASTAHAQSGNGAVVYTYDALGRVTSASYDNNTTITYTYDAAGNRTQQSVVVGSAPGSPPSAPPTPGLLPGQSQWTTVGSGIYYNGGNVGVGTTSPQAELNVVGGLTYLQPSSATPSQGMLMDVTNLSNSSNGIYVSAPTGWTGNIIKSNLNGSEQFAIRQNGSAWFNGNVSIGTTNPGAPLDVEATTAGWAAIVNAPSGYGIQGNGLVGVFGGSTAAGGMGIQGYCSTTPNCGGGWFEGSAYGVYAATTDGYYTFTTYGGYGLYSNGNAWIAGSYQGSDRRLKKDISDMDRGGALATLMKLRPVSFQWRPDSEQALSHKGTQYGLIAQDVAKVLPNIVTQSETPKPSSAPDFSGTKNGKDAKNPSGAPKLSLNQRLGKVYGIDYTALVPWLLASVQQLKTANDNQAGELQSQAAEIQTLRSEIDKLKTHQMAANQ